jgi:hypothetical protein
LNGSLALEAIIDLVNCTKAPFAALQEGTDPEPKMEYMLAILMIFPWRCLIIDWAASFESKKHALRFVSMTLSQSPGA